MAADSSERIPGATPAGGVARLAYFLDARGEPCPKAEARAIEVHELDRDGQSIARMWLETTR